MEKLYTPFGLYLSYEEITQRVEKSMNIYDNCYILLNSTTLCVFFVFLIANTQQKNPAISGQFI